MDIHRRRPGKKKAYKNLTKKLFLSQVLVGFHSFFEKKEASKKNFCFCFKIPDLENRRYFVFIFLGIYKFNYKLQKKKKKRQGDSNMQALN